MRKFAWLGIISLVATFCTGLVLYRLRPATALDPPTLSTQKPETNAGQTSSFAGRGRLSQPAWLLLLGAGLIVSSNWIPGLLRARVRLPLSQVADGDEEPGNLPEAAAITKLG